MRELNEIPQQTESDACRRKKGRTSPAGLAGAGGIPERKVVFWMDKRKQDVIVSVSYACPICGQSNFASPEKALACRDKHTEPTEIVSARFAHGLEIPKKITCWFPGGFQVEYVPDNSITYICERYREHQQQGKGN